MCVCRFYLAVGLCTISVEYTCVHDIITELLEHAFAFPNEWVECSNSTFAYALVYPTNFLTTGRCASLQRECRWVLCMSQCAVIETVLYNHPSIVCTLTLEWVLSAEAILWVFSCRLFGSPWVHVRWDTCLVGTQSHSLTYCHTISETFGWSLYIRVL